MLRIAQKGLLVLQIVHFCSACLWFIDRTHSFSIIVCWCNCACSSSVLERVVKSWNCYASECCNTTLQWLQSARVRALQSSSLNWNWLGKHVPNIFGPLKGTCKWCTAQPLYSCPYVCASGGRLTENNSYSLTWCALHIMENSIYLWNHKNGNDYIYIHNLNLTQFATEKVDTKFQPLICNGLDFISYKG